MALMGSRQPATSSCAPSEMVTTHSGFRHLPVELQTVNRSVYFVDPVFLEKVTGPESPRPPRIFLPRVTGPCNRWFGLSNASPRGLRSRSKERLPCCCCSSFFFRRHSVDTGILDAQFAARRYSAAGSMVTFGHATSIGTRSPAFWIGLPPLDRGDDRGDHGVSLGQCAALPSRGEVRNTAGQGKWRPPCAVAQPGKFSLPARLEQSFAQATSGVEDLAEHKSSLTPPGKEGLSFSCGPG